MLVALALLAFTAAVLLLSRHASARVRIRSCCSARPWPPDDLTRDAPPPIPVPPAG